MEAEFLCPISMEIMKDPVLLAGDGESGMSFERQAIETWLATNNTSPLTGIVLTNKSLIPNRTLKRAIEAYLERSNNSATKSAPASAKAGLMSPPAAPRFKKGDFVEHFRASDAKIRRGRVVGVHSHNPMESAFYTLVLDENEQELQTEEIKLDLPGNWAKRYAAGLRPKFAIGQVVEFKGQPCLVCEVLNQHDIVNGPEYRIAIGEEGDGYETVKEALLEELGEALRRSEALAREQFEMDQAKLQHKQSEFEKERLRFEHKKRIDEIKLERQRRELQEASEKQQQEQRESARQDPITDLGKNAAQLFNSFFTSVEESLQRSFDSVGGGGRQ